MMWFILVKNLLSDPAVKYLERKNWVSACLTIAYRFVATNPCCPAQSKFELQLDGVSSIITGPIVQQDLTGIVSKVGMNGLIWFGIME